MRTAILLTGERLEKAIAFVATYGKEFPLTEVGQAFVVASQQANAAKVFFQETRNMARSIAMPLKQVLALVAIARAEAAADARKEAQDTLDQALAIARGVGDAAEQGQMLAAIASASMQLNDTDQHLESVISAANRFATSMTAIAQAAGQLSDPQSAAAVLEKATTAAEKIDDVSDRRLALSAILKVQEGLGTSETLLDNLPSAPAELKNVLDNALTDVQDSSQLSNYSRHQALLKIIQALRQCPDTASAKALLDRALPIAHGLTLPEFRDKVLGAVAVTYGRIAHWKDAFQTLKLCADEEKTESLTQILDLWVGHHNLAPITNGPQPSTTETKTF